MNLLTIIIFVIAAWIIYSLLESYTNLSKKYKKLFDECKAGSSKESSKDSSKESSKDSSKESSKESSKDSSKESSKDSQNDYKTTINGKEYIVPDSVYGIKKTILSSLKNMINTA